MKLTLLLTCLLAAGNYAFTQSAALQSVNLDVPSEKMTSFNDYELVELDIAGLLAARPADGQSAISLRLNTATGQLPFRLTPWDLRAPGHRLFSAGVGKQSSLLPRRATAQFRGRLETPAGGTAIFTLDDKFVVGTWRDSDAIYHLEPLWRFWPAAPADVYVLYTNANVAELPGACGVTDEDNLVGTGSGSTKRQMGECREVEIALAADFEIFQALGNDAQSVENFMLDGLANVQTNYDDEFDDELSFVVVATVIATSEATDPWSNSTDGSGVLLPNFANWGNNGNFGVVFDVATLWTNRDLDGPAIGWGYIGTACTAGRYNLCQSFTNNAAALRVLWAHELGHNLGADHDEAPGNIMAASVSSATTWSQLSQDVINGYYQSVSCLGLCPDPDPPVAAISAPRSVVCDGSLLTFIDVSTGQVNARNWQFPGATPSSSTAAAPTVVYPAPGTYVATLSVSNDFGADQVQLTVRVSDNSAEEVTILLSETFGGDVASYSVLNPDGLNTWLVDEVEGNAGQFAALINNYDNNLPGAVDQLVFNDIDLTAVTNPTLELEYAYRRYSATLEDELRVVINTPTGSQTVFVGNENGTGNFATGSDLTDRFFPKDENDWCATGPQCISVDLSAFTEESAVQIVIENVNGYGNFMYVDNLLVYGNCSAAVLPVEWLSFTAEAATKTSTALRWSVVQDGANAGFMIQRSVAGGSEWTDLGWVPATATDRADYTFTDRTVAAGTTYHYRLRQEDVDGTMDYSPIETVAFGALARATVYPNPTAGRMALSAPASARNYGLYDLAGRAVLSGAVVDGRAELDLTALPRAVYSLRVGEEVIRVVKR